MRDEPRELTKNEQGDITVRALGGILLAFVIKFAASARPTFPEAMTWVGISAFALFWIYRALPDGRGSTDFKVGMFVGLAAALLCYAICFYGIPAVLGALGV